MRRKLCALLFLAPVGAGAQHGAVPCRGQRIDSILVDAQAPTVSGVSRVPVIGSVVRETHVITREEIIKGYLLFRTGERCTELQRAESERILRAQPFLADASVQAVPSAGGRVNIEVRTIDEASVILSGSLGTTAPRVRSLRVGSANLSGLGIATSVAWHHEPAYTDRLRLRVSDYQFGGRPYVLSVEATRDPFGRTDRAGLMLPFRTDLQRFAWRTMLGESREHALFEERDSARLALGYVRNHAEIGGIVRAGPPGRLSLFGLSFTNERVWPDTTASRVTDMGFELDTAQAFAGRFVEASATRVNALIGVRGIRFMRAQAFDALRAVQDVPLGLQIGTLVGRGIPVFGANSNDVFMAADVYAGFGTPRVAYRLQLQAEGRRQRGTKQWDGLIASGRLARYSRPTERRTRIIAVEWSGTEAVRVPHSLSLGLPDGGLRGFRDATSVGGRRGIARFDERLYLGSPFSFGDLGVAAFADAGRLWAGDLPYGVTTLARYSAGASLVLAVPRGSPRMWRLDFAVPLNRELPARRWELRLSHDNRTTFFWREPADVQAARSGAVPASVYNWP